MNISKWGAFLISFVLLFFCIINRVDAHILKTSGSIGAVVHITPDDDPIAGKQSQFFFDFKDTNGKFKTDICNCKVRILKSNVEIFSQALTSDSMSNSAVFVYTFPERGLYIIKLSGQPLLENTFQPFTLNYDIRVDREDNANGTTPSAASSKPLLLYSVFGIGFLVFIFTIVISRHNHKKE